MKSVERTQQRHPMSVFVVIGVLIGAAWLLIPNLQSTPCANSAELTALRMESLSDTSSADSARAHTCSRAQSVLQAHFFAVGRTSDPGWTACPPFDYMRRMRDVLGAKQQVTVMDIGCNKGYDSAMFFELFAPETNFSRVAVGNWHAGVNTKDHCGVCNDCKEAFAEPDAPPATALHVLCYEPGQKNHQALVKAREAFLPSGRQRHAWTVQRLAVSNITGFVEFSKDCESELCHIGGHDGGATEQVPVTTVDAQFEAQRLDHVDVLKIDTEGFDPLVLDGASLVLSNRRASLVLFEYHGIGHWARDGGRSLAEVVLKLKGYGYTCYFDGKVLTKLTDCWDPSLEIRDWSNVVCAITDSRVHMVLQSYSFESIMHGF